MPDHFYVYPAYLDRQVSRAHGRRVPAAQGVPDVTSEEILQAVQRLGWKAEVEAAKQYPRRSFTYSGRVKVTKRPGTPKAMFLRSVAEELRKLRAQAGRK